MKVGEPFDLIFTQFSKEISEREKKISHIPFRVRCAIMFRRSPRHKYFEFTVNLGMANISKIFNKEALSGNLTFCFPERWMNVMEQRCFISCLIKNPTVDKITCVNIITSSPILIGEFIREQILIMKFEDDIKDEEIN